MSVSVPVRRKSTRLRFCGIKHRARHSSVTVAAVLPSQLQKASLSRDHTCSCAYKVGPLVLVHAEGIDSLSCRKYKDLRCLCELTDEKSVFRGRSMSKMPKLRWKSASCTDRALQFMDVALQRVEEDVETAAARNGADDKAGQKHIPTLINDLLYPKCIAVAVTPNVGEGACFRGMQCAQYSVLGKVYNIAVIMKPEEILANGGEPDSTDKLTV